MSSARVRVCAWLALVAMLMAAFAPTASRLMADPLAQSRLAAVICSAYGPRFVAVDIGANDAPVAPVAPGAAHTADCPYCLTHSGAGAPAVTPFVFAPPLRITQALAVLRASAEYRSPPWAAVHARGPPTVS